MDKDSECGSNDPRESLGTGVTGALSPSYGEQVERFLDNYAKMAGIFNILLSVFKLASLASFKVKYSSDF